ncbi:outer membrane protein assembly factor BamE [Paludibacterium denitrificans]|uniref:outer membrane protein assembly factor BamE n=1 Tax=Paludibacterium denitrificans TaxID=2675226 RepID=UPI001E3BC0B7|nr:outer membrane protein assembly factor BamE [Paludibacterium denitrificans]
MRALIIAAVIALSGCSSVTPLNWIRPYSMDIQQGNYVTQDAVAKLKPGMTRAQVRFVLGSPLLTDAFHANRWDYKYQIMKYGQTTDSKLLTVYFEGDTLVRIEGDALLKPIAPTRCRWKSPLRHMK